MSASKLKVEFSEIKSKIDELSFLISNVPVIQRSLVQQQINRLTDAFNAEQHFTENDVIATNSGDEVILTSCKAGKKRVKTAKSNIAKRPAEANIDLILNSKRTRKQSQLLRDTDFITSTSVLEEKPPTPTDINRETSSNDTQMEDGESPTSLVKTVITKEEIPPMMDLTVETEAEWLAGEQHRVSNHDKQVEEINYKAEPEIFKVTHTKVKKIHTTNIKPEGPDFPPALPEINKQVGKRGKVKIDPDVIHNTPKATARNGKLMVSCGKEDFLGGLVQCSECGKLCFRKVNWIQHLWHSHKIIVEIEGKIMPTKMKSEKEYTIQFFESSEDSGGICDVCGRAFQRKVNWIQHMKLSHKIKLVKDTGAFQAGDKVVYQDHKQVVEEICKTDVKTEEIDVALQSTTAHETDNINITSTELTAEEPLKNDKDEDENTTEEKAEDSELRHDCFVCHKKFLRLMGLKQHLSRHHPDLRDLPCEECGRVFPTTRKLFAHKRTFHSGKQLICDKCTYVTLHPMDLRRHNMRYHGSKDDYPFQCDVCEKRFISGTVLRRHKEVHSTDRPTIKCPFEGCTYESVSAVTLYMHKRNVHTGPRKLFHCDICGKDLKAKDTLETHLRRHLGQYIFQCPVCQASFPCRTQYSNHMLIHKEKSHYCPVCKKAFGTKANMKRHLSVHTGERAFGCPFCGYRCNMITNLRKHCFNRHNETFPPKKLPRVPIVDMEPEGEEATVNLERVYSGADFTSSHSSIIVTTSQSSKAASDGTLRKLLVKNNKMKMYLDEVAQSIRKEHLNEVAQSIRKERANKRMLTVEAIAKDANQQDQPGVLHTSEGTLLFVQTGGQTGNIILQLPGFSKDQDDTTEFLDDQETSSAFLEAGQGMFQEDFTGEEQVLYASNMDSIDLEECHKESGTVQYPTLLGSLNTDIGNQSILFVSNGELLTSQALNPETFIILQTGSQDNGLVMQEGNDLDTATNALLSPGITEHSQGDVYLSQL